MSIDFVPPGARLLHTTATGLDLATLTVCAWVWADSSGGGNFGRVIQADEDLTWGWSLYHSSAGANLMRFGHGWSTTGGGVAAWDWAANDGQWNAIAVSYDRGSSSNVPVARVNRTSPSVSVFTAASGTATAPAAGYCIGNRSGQDRSWDGRIEHIQVFSVLLSIEEMDAALYKPGSIRRGLVGWWPMWTADHINQYVGGGPANPLATSLVTGPGAPCAMPFSGRRRSSYTAVAAAPDVYASLPGLAPVPVFTAPRAW